MRRRFYAILMILMSQASFAADDLVVTVNFLKHLLVVISI